MLYSQEIRNAAAAVRKGMTLREKIGQMVQFYSAQLEPLYDKYSPREIVEKYPYGSFYTGADPIGLIGSRIQGRDMLAEMRSASKCAIMIAGDAENGAGTELLPTGPVLGATCDPQLAYDYGRVLAQRIRYLGFNWSFGPVTDVIMNWLAPAIGVRAMGRDPKLIADMTEQIIKGMQDNGICATAKHFPGDGCDFKNQHLGCAMDNMTREEWEATHGYVYRRVINAGVKSIMAGHIGLSCADDRGLPATLSDRLSTNLLRDELHFEGVLISDALCMSGFVSFQSYEKRMITAVNAGMDVLLWPELDIFDILEKAVDAGDVKESRIDEAAQRVLEMKFWSGVLGKPLPKAEDPKDYSLVAQKIAEKGTVLVKDANHFLPMKQERDRSVLVFLTVPGDASQVKESEVRKDPNLVYFFDELEKRGAKLTFKFNADCLTIQRMEAAGETYDTILALYRNKTYYSNRVGDTEREMIWLMSYFNHSRVIAVSFYSPFLITENPNTPAAIVNVCSECPASQRAAVKLLYGDIPFTGKAHQPLHADLSASEAWAKIQYKSVAR